MPDLHGSGEGQHRRGADGHGFDRLDDDQNPLLRDPVSRHPADQHGADQAHAGSGRDQRQVGGPAAQRDHLPDHRDQPDARAQQRHQQRDRQDAVLRGGERPEGPRRGHRPIIPRGTDSGPSTSSGRIRQAQGAVPGQPRRKPASGPSTSAGKQSGASRQIQFSVITRMSELFVRTLRDDPVDAEVPSHRWLVRAGYIRRAAPGIYSYLPLGYRVYRKVEQIVREEMDAIGAQEVHFPALLPREPYDATGRWTDYGDSIFRLKDRKGGDYLLGPTHEEMFTLLVKDLYSSYKDLPLSLYQIQTKYRDEARPRAGLLRGREFVMKDSYSFDIDDEGLQKSYDLHRDAYIKIFNRLGFEYVIVHAMSGAMGGSASEEFLAVAENGEDTFVRSPGGYAANVEAVRISPPGADRVRRCARRARGGHPGHPDHRDPGRAGQRPLPAQRPTLARRGHVEERRLDGHRARRLPESAGDRAARRPRGGCQTARRPVGAGRGRAVRRGGLRRVPPAGQGLPRTDRARGGRPGPDPLPGRPAGQPGHPVADRRQRTGPARLRADRRAGLHPRRNHRGRRDPGRRPGPGRVGTAGAGPRHRDGPHLPARPEATPRRSGSRCSTRTASSSP